MIDDDSDDGGSVIRAIFLFALMNLLVVLKNLLGVLTNTLASGMGSGMFVPTGINSIGDLVTLVVFIPKEVELKDGQLIEICWRPKS